jgi:hypothetical protein
MGRRRHVAGRGDAGGLLLIHSAPTQATPVAFASIHPSAADPRLLSIPVSEPTKNYRASCWTDYDASAITRGAQLRVTLTNTTPSTSGESVCNSSRLAHYVPVTLTVLYAGQEVVDTVSGHAVRVDRYVAPPAASLVEDVANNADCGVSAITALPRRLGFRAAPEYLGLTLVQARALADQSHCTVRTVGHDGRCAVVTADAEWTGWTRTSSTVGGST